MYFNENYEAGPGNNCNNCICNNISRTVSDSISISTNHSAITVCAKRFLYSIKIYKPYLYNKVEKILKESISFPCSSNEAFLKIEKLIHGTKNMEIE